jgi:hypothetical protein
MTHAAPLTTEEFEVLKLLALTTTKIVLPDEIRERLIKLNLIEEGLGRYLVTSRGHARMLRSTRSGR